MNQTVTRYLMRLSPLTLFFGLVAGARAQSQDARNLPQKSRASRRLWLDDGPRPTNSNRAACARTLKARALARNCGEPALAASC